MLCNCFRNLKYLLFNVRSLISLNALRPHYFYIRKHRSARILMCFDLSIFHKLKAAAAPGIRSNLMNAGSIKGFSKHIYWLNSLYRHSSGGALADSACDWVKSSFHFSVIPHLRFSDWSVLEVAYGAVFLVSVIIIIFNDYIWLINQAATCWDRPIETSIVPVSPRVSLGLVLLWGWRVVLSIRSIVSPRLLHLRLIMRPSSSVPTACLTTILSLRVDPFVVMVRVLLSRKPVSYVMGPPKTSGVKAWLEISHVIFISCI